MDDVAYRLVSDSGCTQYGTQIMSANVLGGYTRDFDEQSTIDILSVGSGLHDRFDDTQYYSS